MTGKIESVKAEVPVETSRERTFQVFVEGIDRWWPRSHHVGKARRYEPPGLLVLAWQLNKECSTERASTPRPR